MDLVGLKRDPYSLEPLYFLQCFDTVGWIIWPIKTCPWYDL